MPKKHFSGLCTLAILVLIIGAAKTVAYAQTFTVLNNFDPTNNGPWLAEYPDIITQGRDGNLYFTTLDGGNSQFSDGGIFQMTPAGALTLLASFGGNQFSNRPRNPSGLTLGTDGNFYGITIEGGSGVPTDFGTVFQVTPTGVITFRYNFSGGADGGFPYAPPIQASDGNFYGTTSGMGGVNSNAGTVYQLTPAGIFTTLYQIDSSGSTGAFPSAPLVQGTDGNL
jgi:uncharacterized repeat protein (TIGR03803 family)